ncbi:MAG: hypothetical protein ABIP93_20505 [Gemmatimonadaceae bacterium]
MDHRNTIPIARVTSAATTVVSPHIVLRENEVSASAPVAWVTRSLLEEIVRSASTGASHSGHGALRGYWVTPARELVISAWAGYSSELHRYNNRANVMGTKTAEALRPESASTTASVDLGTWIEDSVGRNSRALARAIGSSRKIDGSFPEGLVLVLTCAGVHTWVPRLWLPRPNRRVWRWLGHPLRLQLRLFPAVGQR